MNDAKMERFRDEVMSADQFWGCCNSTTIGPFVHHTRKATLPAPGKRNYFEAAHLCGRARDPGFKYDPRNGMRLCWWCHDAVDGRHNELRPDLTPDERKVKILDWWEENRPEHYKMRGWAKAHDKLRASVARRQADSEMGSTRSKE